MLQTTYHGFGPMLAAEHLAADDGLDASRETVRGWITHTLRSGGLADRLGGGGG